MTEGRAAGRTDGRTDIRTKNGRKSGRTDASTDGRTDGRTGGQTGGRTNGRTDGRASRRTGKRTAGRTDERTNGRREERTKGRTCGRTGGLADGRTNGQTGGRTDSIVVSSYERRMRAVPPLDYCSNRVRLGRPSRLPAHPSSLLRVCFYAGDILQTFGLCAPPTALVKSFARVFLCRRHSPGLWALCSHWQLTLPQQCSAALA